MLMEQALALYDEGAALPNVLEQLLTSAGDRRIEVGSQIIKSILACRTSHRIAFRPRSRRNSD